MQTHILHNAVLCKLNITKFNAYNIELDSQFQLSCFRADLGYLSLQPQAVHYYYYAHTRCINYYNCQT